jgi:hypothetical protein
MDIIKIYPTTNNKCLIKILPQFDLTKLNKSQNYSIMNIKVMINHRNLTNIFRRLLFCHELYFRKIRIIMKYNFNFIHIKKILDIKKVDFNSKNEKYFLKLPLYYEKILIWDRYILISIVFLFKSIYNSF